MYYAHVTDSTQKDPDQLTDFPETWYKYNGTQDHTTVHS